MVRRKEPKLGRRNFLKAGALGGAAMMAAPATAMAAKTPKKTSAAPLHAAAETGPVPPPGPSRASAGSDYMVDVLRRCGIRHMSAIPASTFKGLHESVINYGMLSEPKLDHLTVTHEETSVAMCHGYFKVSGEMMGAMVHATVGLQHAAMAIYDAYCDRVPVFVLAGAQLDAAGRTRSIDWVHSVNDGPALTREFVKWDDTPVSLTHFGESAVRAYKFAMTPPYGPVVLAVDEMLQEDELPGGKAPKMPKLTLASVAEGDENAVREAAKLLVAADSPVIVVDRAARTPKGMKLIVELAEALQAPVVDLAGRMNMPWRHPLNLTFAQDDIVPSADCILGLELTSFWEAARPYPASAKRISISTTDLYMKSSYQSFARYAETDISIAADAEATLPSLIAAVRSAGGRSSAFRARGNKYAQLHRKAMDASREKAAIGWDLSPITTGRMNAELYNVIRHEDWGLTALSAFQNSWPQRLWDGDKYHHYIGGSGGYGVGYNSGAALGAALAHKEKGRIAICVVGDGDLMMGPGVLWSAAHENLPLLYIVHNNRAWHQEAMWVQRFASMRGRGIDRAHIGTLIHNPDIDFAMMAKSMGVYAEGPIDNPADLGPALRRAVDVVKRGEPALVDVVMQAR